MNELENCFTHDKLSMYLNSPVNEIYFSLMTGVIISLNKFYFGKIVSQR